MVCNTRANRRRGFTLMEVLIVLAILVMLVGMVAPKILSSQKKADVNAAKTQIGLFQSTLEHYAMDMKTYPTTEQGLAALISKPSDLDESAPWAGPYLNGDSIPKDPWNREYKYEYPPTHGSGDRPDIWSSGPDGEDESDDDITSWTKGAEGESKK
jgi:general secretion pathway protein G